MTSVREKIQVEEKRQLRIEVWEQRLRRSSQRGRREIIESSGSQKPRAELIQKGDSHQ